MIDHKVIRSYMVRKKQGKSQIKHLKTRGKSRAGSRLRLANTYRFFRDIHERLSRYLDNYKIGRIALSCSATLIPYLFSNKIPPSFLKTDHRIFKIPTHVNKPDYRNLLMVHSFLLSGELQAHDTTHPWIDTLLPHL